MAKSRYKLVDLGTIRDYDDTLNVGRKYRVTFAESGRFIGTLGVLKDPYPGNPRYYVTPYDANPCNTTNGVRTWHNRGAALAWLEGISDTSAEWLTYAKDHLKY